MKLAGLDADKIYRVEEINRYENARPSLGKLEGRTVSGEYLMNRGLELFSASRARSVVVELTAVL